MKKIEEAMCKAVLGGKPFTRSGTSVRPTFDENTGEFHHAYIKIGRSEIGHYYWSGHENSWVIRLTNNLVLNETVLSRLNALAFKVAKGGSRIVIYPVLDANKKPWAYKMGANRYRWEGAQLFLAHEPTTAPIGATVS